MATYSNTNGRSQKRTVQYDNFIEALRDLGKSTLSEAKTQIKQSFKPQVPEVAKGDLKPNESFSLTDLQQAEKKGFEQAKTRFDSNLEQFHQEERSRLLREEAAARQQIKAIQEEVRSLAKSMGDFAHEVEVASFQAPVNPGAYHKGFFNHLKILIVSLKERVESSKNWLQATNQRAGKRGYFWTQSSKMGTQYMLSSERYMVMSTG